MMLTNTLSNLFIRDLDRLTKEIDCYKKEESLWIAANGISNSAGNLCLHLLGNLNTYIGTNLGNTGYVRDRPTEFSLKNIPKKTLLEEIDLLKTVIKNTFNKLEDNDLEQIYPEEVLGYPMTTQYFMVHLAAHLNYHLGQINYHRRLLTD